ncbi:L-xylulose reductase [Fusarium oxysporum f. sp. albedinis]|nr:L-xylulose reductase [Fusarium oxysporum f. sp. albedinis]
MLIYGSAGVELGQQPEEMVQISRQAKISSLEKHGCGHGGPGAFVSAGGSACLLAFHKRECYEIPTLRTTPS